MKHENTIEAAAARREWFNIIKAKTIAEAQARATIRDKVVKALEMEGSTREGADGGYEILASTRTPGEFYFIGKHGSLRVGPTLDKSRNMTHAISAILEANGF